MNPLQPGRLQQAPGARKRGAWSSAGDLDLNFFDFKYALGFTGGSPVEVRFAQPTAADTVRARFAAAEFPEAQVQRFGSGSDLLIRLRPQRAQGAAGANERTDLSIVASLLSAMGFSINDKIVVYDRVRENFRSLRASPVDVMNRSINQTLSRTIITSLVFLLSMLALYWFGGATLEGLAATLMAGVVIGTLSSIFAACPLLTVGPLKVGAADLTRKAEDRAQLDRRP